MITTYKGSERSVLAQMYRQSNTAFMPADLLQRIESSQMRVSNFIEMTRLGHMSKPPYERNIERIKLGIFSGMLSFGMVTNLFRLTENLPAILFKLFPTQYINSNGVPRIIKNLCFPVLYYMDTLVTCFNGFTAWFLKELNVNPQNSSLIYIRNSIINSSIFIPIIEEILIRKIFQDFVLNKTIKKLVSVFDNPNEPSRVSKIITSPIFRIIVTQLYFEMYHHRVIIRNPEKANNLLYTRIITHLVRCISLNFSLPFELTSSMKTPIITHSLHNLLCNNAEASIIKISNLFFKMFNFCDYGTEFFTEKKQETLQFYGNILYYSLIIGTTMFAATKLYNIVKENHKAAIIDSYCEDLSQEDVEKLTEQLAEVS